MSDVDEDDDGGRPGLALALRRRFYAEEVCAVAGVTSARIVDAFAAVPRERYLPPGPWRIPVVDGAGVRYRTTPDADPAHVLHNVPVALDESRNLNSGQPSTLAAWLDALDVDPGDRVLHVGGGTGAYTAVIAQLAGTEGRVTMLEVDDALRAQARGHFTRAGAGDTAAVLVRDGDGSVVDGRFDRILVNAGCTRVPAQFLDALDDDDGVLLIPLTMSGSPGVFAATAPYVGSGVMLRVRRRGAAFAAGVVGFAGIFACSIGRDDESERALKAALGQGKLRTVKSIRREPHAAEADCVAHVDGACLSSR